jgi:hypothetical protein
MKNKRLKRLSEGCSRGDKVKFINVGMFWHKDMRENGKKLLIPGNTYTISSFQLFSSHSVLTLEETGDAEYCGWWFQKV